MQEFRTKKEMIYQIIKDEILNGDFEFGDKLVISHLAKRFGSSEIPIREAISQLESDGLIEFKPHIGAVVSTLSLEDIREILDLRIVLEGFATREATEHLTEQHFEKLNSNINDSKMAFELKDYEWFEKLNREFHNIIYSSCNNHLLVKTIDDLWSNTKRYPSLFKKNDEHIRTAMQEHIDIVEALKNKDRSLAEKFMIHHKTRAKEEIMNAHVLKES